MGDWPGGIAIDYRQFDEGNREGGGSAEGWATTITGRSGRLRRESSGTVQKLAFLWMGQREGFRRADHARGLTKKAFRCSRSVRKHQSRESPDSDGFGLGENNRVQ